MESLATPLRALAEEVAWFARDRDTRLLHVVTTADLRDQVMSIVMAQEFHADNRAPFVRLDDGFTVGDAGWSARTQRLRAHHAQRAEVMARQGVTLPPLGPAPTGRDALVNFAVQTRQLAAAWVPPLKGLVVVLAPTRVDKPDEWDAVIEGLVTAQGMVDVRWVIVDLERPTISHTVAALGPRALGVAVTVDAAAADDELAATLTRAAAAMPGAPAWAAMGAAWPSGVAPPPRIGETTLPNAELKAALVAAGVAPPVTPEEGRQLRNLVLRAAQALKAQQGPAAVRLQREARDLCDQLAMPGEAIVMELILGAYLVQLRQQPLAMETYRRAAARAEQLAMPKEGAQAHLALGALEVIQKQPDQAAVTYARAGQLAHQAGALVLAIEAYRMSGNCCRDVGIKVATWQRALQVAGEIEPSTLPTTSAAETARALAEVLLRAGLRAQASEMQQQAAAFERGEAPPSAEAGASGSGGNASAP